MLARTTDGARCERWLAAMSLLAAGCTLDFDQVGPRGGSPDGGAPANGGEGGETATGGEAAGGAASCDGTCVDLAGFQGPFTIGGAGCVRPSVIGGYADEIAPAFDAQPATCGCSCEPPDFMACTLSSVTFYDESSCLGAADGPIPLIEDQCRDLAALGFTAYSLLVTSDPGSATGSCESDGALPVVPPLTFADPFQGCDAAAEPCGASSRCLPADASGACVVGAVTLPCPAGFEVERDVLLADEMADDRDCTCGCGLLTAACSPGFLLFADTACADSVAPAEVASCTQAFDLTRFDSITYDPVAISPVCAETTDGGTTGTVTPGPIRRLCCME